MRVISIGGGPAGLYFSILFKKLVPEAEITVYERNRPDDTFGWGVVFSDETMGNFLEADSATHAAIQAEFVHWTELHTFVGGSKTVSTGHGFSGMERKRLLQLLQERCRDLEVELVFEHDVTDVDRYLDADLVLGADGINSTVRERFADVLRPSLDWRKCKFTWLGADFELPAFTFIFRENEHGLFQVHAYPFAKGLSTWIVECREEVWRSAGLDQATEEDTAAYMEELWADHLDGHRLLINRSMWRTFPTIRCERWHHENVVLLGDAVHTAHFSIGSGTKLAMEDAITLANAFRVHGTEDVPKVLAAFQDARAIDTLKLQKAAQTSLEWFENSARYLRQSPAQFTFNLMTRSKRITYDNLEMRDPELVEDARKSWWQEAGLPRASDGSVPPPMFAPLRLRKLELPNRVVVSPMCQYSAVDGTVGEWHLVHLGARAVGGAGLVICEMTNVSAEGRITRGCAGIYDDAHVDAWKRVVDFVHANTAAKIGLQLGHAGRKGSCNLPWEGDDPLRDETAWECIGPSAVPFDEGWPAPREMDRADMDRVVREYIVATTRAEAAGFDMVELHMAHGYLLSSFLSPTANFRTDEYGGSLESRLRYPLEVLDAVRAAWPAGKPLSVRISASDWMPDGSGLTEDDAVEIARALEEHGCDLVDVSSGGNTPRSEPVYGRMYQVPFAERIKHGVGIPVMAVGAIQGHDHVNTLLLAGRADLCALARPHLVNPQLVLGAAVAYEYTDHAWPRQYLPAKPTPRED
jgi:anthraniloyl-CoA monooxygenase